MNIADSRDVWIHRDGQSDLARLYDCNGDLLGVFPHTMTDDQIMIALSFANTWFARGVERGQLMKAEQLRAVLGITN